MYSSSAKDNALNAPHLIALASAELGRTGPLKKPVYDSVGKIFGWPGYSVGWEASCAASMLRSLLASEWR